MTYDDRGRKLTETNQMSQTRTFEYDLMGRLKSVTLPQLSGSTEAAKYFYGYDAEGRQTSLIDPLGRETTWEFDSQGRQIGRTLPLGFGLDGMKNTSDDSGPVGQTFLSVWTERMEYDTLGRQKLSISFEGAVTEYVYDTYGRMSGQRFFTSMAAYNNGTGTPTEVWTTTQDAFGRMLTSVRSTINNQPSTTTYQYDAEGRSSQVSSPEGVISYTYDTYGRKTSTVVGTLANPQRTTSYTYDSQGRLQTVSESTGVTSYAYELNGSTGRMALTTAALQSNEAQFWVALAVALGCQWRRSLLLGGLVARTPLWVSGCEAQEERSESCS